MAFQLDATAIAHVSMNPAVRDAVAVGAGLIELWPLTDAKQMDNDTKYGENLQVRMTRMAARVMTGDDVTVPDAEFVYEGADEIPGRPQRIVDALLAANDAYDEMGDYSETGDTRLIMRGAGQLGVDWDDDTVHAIAEALEAIEQAIGMGDGAAGGADAAGAAAPANAAPSADVEAIAQRFAAVTVAADGLLRLIDLRKPSRAVPVMFYVNELCERLRGYFLLRLSACIPVPLLRTCVRPEYDKEGSPPVESSYTFRELLPIVGCLLQNRCIRVLAHSGARKVFRSLPTRLPCGLSARCFFRSAFGGGQD